MQHGQPFTVVTRVITDRTSHFSEMYLFAFTYIGTSWVLAVGSLLHPSRCSLCMGYTPGTLCLQRRGLSQRHLHLQEEERSVEASSESREHPPSGKVKVVRFRLRL